MPWEGQMGSPPVGGGVSPYEPSVGSLRNCYVTRSCWARLASSYVQTYKHTCTPTSTSTSSAPYMGELDCQVSRITCYRLIIFGTRDRPINQIAQKRLRQSNPTQSTTPSDLILSKLRVGGNQKLLLSDTLGVGPSLGIYFNEDR